jgi:beta-N-acetylhexosaminidase
MEQLGKLYDQAPKEAVRLTEACGFIMASEVLAVGVDLSFAPVLDLSTGINPAINGRAFHHDANLIVLLATAFVKGMRKAGMAAVGKHFPGHGSVLVDSHLDLPVDKRTLQEIAETDMVPFQRMIAHGLEGIMAAHIHFSAVDKTAVGFSSFWLQEVLRSQLKFTGMIFSDDLCMEGAKIAGDFPERVIAALEAGCDMALVCNNPDKVKKTLDGLPNEYKMIAPEKYKTLQGKVLQRPKVLEDSLVWREQQAVFTELTAQLNT